MEVDFEKLLKCLKIENSLLLLGALSILVSIYNKYPQGIEFGFWFLVAGIIFRFYNLSIVRGIILNYLHKPKYREEKRVFNKLSKEYDVKEFYRIPFKDSWFIHLLDFLFCMGLLLLLIYLFIILN